MHVNVAIRNHSIFMFSFYPKSDIRTILNYSKHFVIFSPLSELKTPDLTFTLHGSKKYCLCTFLLPRDKGNSENLIMSHEDFQQFILLLLVWKFLNFPSYLLPYVIRVFLLTFNGQKILQFDIHMYMDRTQPMQLQGAVNYGLGPISIC